MSRNAMLKIVNPCLCVLLISQVLTGILGSMLPRKAFALLHKGGGFLFASAVVVHVALNWGWVKATFLRSSSRRAT